MYMYMHTVCSWKTPNKDLTRGILETSSKNALSAGASKILKKNASPRAPRTLVFSRLLLIRYKYNNIFLVRADCLSIFLGDTSRTTKPTLVVNLLYVV